MRTSHALKQELGVRPGGESGITFCLFLQAYPKVKFSLCKTLVNTLIFILKIPLSCLKSYKSNSRFSKISCLSLYTIIRHLRVDSVTQTSYVAPSMTGSILHFKMCSQNGVKCELWPGHGTDTFYCQNSSGVTQCTLPFFASWGWDVQKSVMI